MADDPWGRRGRRGRRGWLLPYLGYMAMCCGIEQGV